MQTSPTVSPTHPSVRIYHSSPTPTPTAATAAAITPSPMLVQSHIAGGWTDEYNQGNTYLSALPRTFQGQRFHKRGSSGSSVTSGGPPSPLNSNTNNIYPHIVATSDSTFPSTFDFEYTQTPQTAKSESTIMYPTHTGFGAVDMRRIQSTSGDDGVSYNLSAPQSVSTMSHNSPATPLANYEPEYEIKDQNVYAGYPSTHTAAYQQTLQDVFPNDFAQQQMAFNQAQQNMRHLNMAANSHRQTMMAERLQAAQHDHLRTNSPTSNPREKSPFRQNSPFMPAPPRQRPQPPATLHKQRTSISPKELMLDEHDIDDSNPSPLLAPDHTQGLFGNPRATSHLSNFYTPDSNIQIPAQYPFVSQQRSSLNSGFQDMNPEFPAHLISMESTADEGSMPSSQQSLPSRSLTQATSQTQSHSQSRSNSHSKSQSQPQPHAHVQQPQRQARRPVDTSSDSGTYSCTFDGCHMRFETAAKLHAHKRASHSHRQTSPTSPLSPDLAARNSQAGPHRCTLTNPTTKKPCNSVFSRPYDLTRHEDTIHSNRKQKVRCHICTEEKTFSRADALTRHMRVVHPDVEWAGKQKRKSPAKKSS